MNWQRLRAAGAFVLAGAFAACAPLDEPTTPPTTDDGASFDNDVTETLVETEQTVNRVTIGEFVAEVNPMTGELSIEMLDPSEWLTELDLSNPLRETEQADWCPIRVTNGRVDTVTLVNNPGSIAFTPTGCGLPSTLPYSALGAFCGDVGVTNNFTDVLENVQAEILFVDPDASYYGYTFGETGGLIGTDPSTLPGVGAPTDTFGLFGYGDIASNSTTTSQWVFKYAGGVFRFAGRIVAVVGEQCNGIDDDCDGIIDEEGGCFLEGDACTVNADCVTGNCDGGTGLCGPSLCGDGTLNGDETAVAGAIDGTDCGGSVCLTCEDGFACLGDSDCTSGVCLDGTCAPFDRPVAGELVITEFLANPAGDESVREYVEVLNPTSETFDLQGCSLTDGVETYTFPMNSIAAPGYVVLARGGAPTADDAPAGDITYTGAFVLANSADTITIECPGPIVIDTVTYTEAQAEGVSTQLDADFTTALSNDVAANLCPTPSATFAPLGTLGTPGAANEQCIEYDLSTGYCTVDAGAAFTVSTGGNYRLQASLNIPLLTALSDGVDTNASVVVEVGYGATGVAETSPSWNWTTATAAPNWYDTTGVDGYQATFALPMADGSYQFAARVSTDGGATYSYCDRNLGVGQEGTADGFDLANTPTVSAVSGLAAPAAAGDLVITEVMANGINVGAEELSEFVELHNPGGVDLDLEGCIIADNNRPGNDHTVDSSIVVPAGGYTVITHSGTLSGSLGLLGDYWHNDFFNLSNGGDAFVVECGGTEIDLFDWDANNDDVITEGRSAQLAPGATDAATNNDTNYWCFTPTGNTFGDGSSTGTPGAANPECAVIDSCEVFFPATLPGIIASSANATTVRYTATGHTDQSTSNDDLNTLIVEIGQGPTGSDPSVDNTQWTFESLSSDLAWTDGTAPNADQFTGDLTAPSIGNTNFLFGARVSVDNGLTYSYCDTNGGAFAAADLGTGDTAETYDLSGDGSTCTFAFASPFTTFAGQQVLTDISLVAPGVFPTYGNPPAASLVAEFGYGAVGETDTNNVTFSQVLGGPAATNAGANTDYDWTNAFFLAPTSNNGNGGAYDTFVRISGDGGTTFIDCAATSGVSLQVNTASVDFASYGFGTESVTAEEFTSFTFDLNWTSFGLTDLTSGYDENGDVDIEFGYGPTTADAATSPNDFVWFDAAPDLLNFSFAGDDRWTYDATLPAAGTYNTAWRISTDGGTTYTYVYASGALGTGTHGTLTTTAAANAPCLIFSQVIEGSSNNKGVEIHNCGTTAVDLAEIDICWENNSSVVCDSAFTVNTTGSLAAGAEYRICSDAADPALEATCDVLYFFSDANPIHQNGDDRLGLFRDINGDGELTLGEPLYDLLGQSGVDPGSGSATNAWGERTLVRLPNKCDAFATRAPTDPFTVADFYDVTLRGGNSWVDFTTFGGCIDADFFVDFAGDVSNGFHGISNEPTLSGDAFVFDSPVGNSGIRGPSFDCTGDGDLEVTLSITANTASATTGTFIAGAFSVPVAIGAGATGDFTWTVAGSANAVVPAMDLNFSTFTGDITVDSIAVSCPLFDPGASVGDLVITEFFVADADHVYVEIHNTTGSDINPQNIGLTIDGNTLYLQDFVGAAHNIPAGGYYVAQIESVTAGFAGLGAANGNNYQQVLVDLANTSSVSLLSGERVLDTVALDGGTNFPSGATVGIQLDPTKLNETDNDAATSWCDATVQTFGSGPFTGSPGAANDPCPSLGNTPTTYDQLVITEFQPLGDGALEFVEIYNPTTQDFDLFNCGFGDNGTGGMAQDHTIGAGAGDTVVEAGTYFVFGATANAVTDNAGVSLVDYVYNEAFGLGGGGDNITIVCGGTDIASIDYVGGFPTPWGYDSTTTAISAQLDVNHLNQYAAPFDAFWCGATGNYFADAGGTETRQGTPGAANEACGIGAPAAPSANEVIITESMGSPDGSDSVYEFVELFNTTTSTFDLSGVVLDDGDNTLHAFVGPLLIGPGEYLIIGDTVDAVQDASGTSLVDYIFDIGVSGSGDPLFLCTDGTDDTTCQGSLLTDAPNYGSYDSNQSATLDPGWIDPADGGYNDVTKWCSDDMSVYANGQGTANGTPGAANYDCPGVAPATAPPTVQNLLITEIADPNNNSGARYVEIYNADAAAVDLSNYALVRWTNGDSGSFSSTLALSGTLNPGEFFFACNDSATFNATYTENCDLDGGGGGPVDSNGDDQIGLQFTFDSSIVDFFGQEGEDGSGTDHEFENGRVERDCTTTGVTDTSDFTANAATWIVDGDNGNGDGAQDAPAGFDPGAWSCLNPANLLITEIADPNNDDSARYVEIYNASGGSVDLSNYALRRWTNDNTEAQTTDLALTGTLADGEFLIACNNKTNFDTVYTPAVCDLDGAGAGSVDSNGDDQIGLFYLFGGDTVVDFFGQVGEDGSGTDHEFEDGRVERVSTSMTRVTDLNDFTANAATWDIDHDSGGGAGAQDAPAGYDPGAWIGAAPPEVDACIANPCGANASCTDIPGSDNTTAGRSCACDPGYENFVEGAGCTAIPTSFDVFITEVADPNNSSATDKYIELYNGGASAVDLSQFVLVNYSNGSTTAGGTQSLSGTLNPGEFFIFCNNAAAFDAAYPATCDQDGNVFINGDDVVQLETVVGGTVIDAMGALGVDGTGTVWEYEDGRAERGCTTTMAEATFDPADWNFDSDQPTGDGALDAPGGFDPGMWSCLAMGATCPSTLTVNEVNADPTTNQYIELYDSSAGAVSLDGCTITVYQDLLGTATVADSIDLDGQSTDASGFYTVTRTDGTLLAASLTANGVVLYDADATDYPTLSNSVNAGDVVDAIVMTASASDTSGMATTFSTTEQNEDANTAKATESVSRTPDGGGTFAIQTETPGATNVLTMASGGVFFSEYVEGSSFNKYLEVFNGTGATINLDDYALGRITNGGTGVEASYAFPGATMLAANATFTVCESRFSGSASCDDTDGFISHNGDDAFALYDGDTSGTIIDVIGEFPGGDPGSGWDICGVTNGTANRTLVRKTTVCEGNTSWDASRGTNTTDCEWVVSAQDDFASLNTHGATCP